MTPSGIEPVTFRLVAHCHNCATMCPDCWRRTINHLAVHAVLSEIEGLHFPKFVWTVRRYCPLRQ